MDLSDGYNLSPLRRELFFRILNDVEDIHPIAHRLKFLEDHFPSKKIDKALCWLINNNIIGKSFLGWFQTVCKSSDLEMHRILLSIVDNIAMGQVVAGRNFKL